MNFQNIPRKDKVVKRGLIPKLDAFVIFDYSQIEYRFFAYFLAKQLGDYSWADNFKKGIDPHEATARLMLGLPPEHTVTEWERQVGKTGNFSILFAGGVPTLMRQLDCDKKKAAYLLKQLRESMPGLGSLNEVIEETVRERGYLITPWGRHLHPDHTVHKADAERKMLNALIQGSAADLLKHATIVVHNNLLSHTCHIVNIVHDELTLDSRKEQIDYLVENVPTWMGDERIHSVVPIEVDVSVSFTNWGDKEEYALHLPS